MRSFERSDVWINAGYFVLRPEIFDYMGEGEELVAEPFRRLIEADQLMAYKHNDFFRAMDTLKDRQVLEEMVEQGRCPGAFATAPSLAADCPLRPYESPSILPGRMKPYRFWALGRMPTISRSARAAPFWAGSPRVSGSRFTGAC